MKTVLLIDDDAEDREIFSDSLLSLQLGVRFEEAENGFEALVKLNSAGFKKPDLIFVDLNMPVMDGKQFLILIKQDKNLKDIPVIIYSTSSSLGDKAFALEHQAVLFMTKQYSIIQLQKELKQTINDFLNL
ncbi:response regulator [Flavobacterium limi]|uniref:Response regulator n=1 Tax=Flavobacterium limi TaxID=2045105 RepID=A0ABQ1UWE4_9FLAO|nr:response regulator [Flavobacterium limi]GGF28256.1 response regulator [Flavobacterium limi]